MVVFTEAQALQQRYNSGDLFLSNLAFAPVWDPLVVLARILKL